MTRMTRMTRIVPNPRHPRNPRLNSLHTWEFPSHVLPRLLTEINDLPVGSRRANFAKVYAADFDIHRTAADVAGSGSTNHRLDRRRCC
jgi:hypothetical protein